MKTSGLSLRQLTNKTLMTKSINKQGNRRYQTLPTMCNCTLNSINFLNLSPINAKLTLLSYVHASKYIFSPQTFIIIIATIATLMYVSVILPINRQISVSLLPQFANNFKMVGWLEFNVPFQHKYGYIRNERCYPYSVKEGQRYINLIPGRIFVQQTPKKGKGLRGSFKLLH